MLLGKTGATARRDSMGKIVATIEKNSREEIRVSVDDWKGYDLVSLRVFFRRKDGEPLPTKKGITFDVKLLPEIIRALEAARKAAIGERCLSGNDGA